MAEQQGALGRFFNRIGNTVRNIPSAGRDYFRRNYTPDGLREQFAEGGLVNDANVLRRTIARNSNPANFLGSLITGVGRDAWSRSASPINPSPSYGDTSPVRGSVSVGNINTDGSGTPYYINPITGTVSQNNFPGVTGPYQHQPQVQQPVTLPQYSPPANTTGLPGITSSLAGTGYGPSMSSPSGFAGNAGASWGAASSASGGARLYGGNGFADNGTGTWDWRTFMIER